MKPIHLIGIVLLAWLSACTSTSEIIIDKRGVDLAKYEADKAECSEYSSEVQTGAKVAKGSASSAVVGGAIGAVLDGSKGAARGAGVGAITGAAQGARRGSEEEISVVKRCLAGRGYRVLN